MKQISLNIYNLKNTTIFIVTHEFEYYILTTSIYEIYLIIKHIFINKKHTSHY